MRYCGKQAVEDAARPAARGKSQNTYPKVNGRARLNQPPPPHPGWCVRWLESVTAYSGPSSGSGSFGAGRGERSGSGQRETELDRHHDQYPGDRLPLQDDPEQGGDGETAMDKEAGRKGRTVPGNAASSQPEEGRKSEGESAVRRAKVNARRCGWEKEIHILAEDNRAD